MQEAIRQQFGAGIESLAAAIRACPDTTWFAGRRWFQPWYVAFHATFQLAWYLADGAAGFRPPPPFTTTEMEEDAFPPRPYTREEVLGWLMTCPQALEARLLTLSDEQGAGRRVVMPWGDVEASEVLLHALRHLQHHTGQLNLLVRLGGSKPARWVARRDEQAPAS